MKKEIERLEAEIERLLEQAEQIDAEQDTVLGSQRGDKFPDELKRRQGRLAKIQDAKARLETGASKQVAGEHRCYEEEQTKREAERRRGKERAPSIPPPRTQHKGTSSTPRRRLCNRVTRGSTIRTILKPWWMGRNSSLWKRR